MLLLNPGELYRLLGASSCYSLSSFLVEANICKFFLNCLCISVLPNEIREEVGIPCTG